jgi:hypothetical protein
VHRTRTFRGWLLVALGAAAIAAPAPGGAQEPPPKGDQPRSPVVVEVRRDGFHWADAGVGAAATLATIAIAAGVAAVRRDRRDGPRTRETS